jgi:uncharacterized membrane protein
MEGLALLRQDGRFNASALITELRAGHLRDLRNIGTPEVVIGGDASFDTVFVNQLLSLLFS